VVTVTVPLYCLTSINMCCMPVAANNARVRGVRSLSPRSKRHSQRVSQVRERDQKRHRLQRRGFEAQGESEGARLIGNCVNDQSANSQSVGGGEDALGRARE
jgi:hypothetical protein